jgi:hypothetical protein
MVENRAWREIAEEVSTGHNSEKVAELAEELIQALDEQAKQRPQHRSQSDEEKVRKKSA